MVHHRLPKHAGKPAAGPPATARARPCMPLLCPYLLLSAVMLLLLTCPLFAQTPSPRPADPIDALIADLGGDSWRTRQKAQEELVEMGEVVRPRLLEILRQTHDEEVRTRAQAALRQLDQRRATGASLLSLHLKNASPQQVFAELARQSGVFLRTDPPNLWEARPATGIDLDIDRQPFWAALRQINGKLNFGLIGSEQELLIADTSRNGLLPPLNTARLAISGPFLILGTFVNTNRSVELNQPQNIRRSGSVQFLLLAEPKIRLLQYSSAARLELAQDEKGNSLLVPAVVGEYMQPAHSAALYLNAPLLLPADPGQRIARLKGAVRLAVQSRSQQAEVANVLAQPSAWRSVAGRRFLFQQARQLADSYQVQVRLYRGGWNPGEWDARLPASGFKLLDADGIPLTPLRPTWGAGLDQIELTMQFRRQPWAGGQRPGEPAKLVWEVPVEMRPISVPFEFTDLPLP